MLGLQEVALLVCLVLILLSDHLQETSCELCMLWAGVFGVFLFCETEWRPASGCG